MRASFRIARPVLAQLLPLVVAAGAAAACKSKPNPASGGSAESAGAPGKESTCRAIRTGSAVVLGTKTEKSAPSREGDEEEEPAVDLPFSVELGEARAGEKQFVVPAIENRSGANFAVLAVVDAVTGSGNVLELGRVYGDVDPPVVAPFGERFLIAVPDGDVAALRLRLMLLSPPYTAKELRRGPEVTGVRRDAPAYALGVSGNRALLVFNALEKERGRLALAPIDANELALGTRPTRLAAPGTAEAEGPRLAARPSGHYLAYLARAPAKERRPLREIDRPDAGPSEELIEEGPSALEIVPLDAQGVAVAAPLRLTPAGAHVLAFDVAPLRDGQALVVYRAARGPGLDQEEAQAVLVRADGTFEPRAWNVGESAGVPSLLVDPAPALPARSGWVAIADESASKLAAIGADPLALGELASDPELSASELLSVRGGRFLAAIADGTRRTLVLVDCTKAARFR
jgi:hypothetical protein